MTAAAAQADPGLLPRSRRRRPSAGRPHPSHRRRLSTKRISPPHSGPAFSTASRTKAASSPSSRLTCRRRRSASPARRSVIEHPRLPFISHPYEWSFEALRAAALHHLDVHLEAMEGGLTLSDASAYNVQFVGTRSDLHRSPFLPPVSRGRDLGRLPAVLRAVPESAPPLRDHGRHAERLVSRRAGGNTDRRPPPPASLGAPSSRAASSCTSSPTRRWRRPGRPPTTPAGSQRAPRCRARAFLNKLRDLRAWLSKLAPKRGNSLWSDYAQTCSYSDEEHAAKRREIAAFAAAVQPKMLWDMGCNTGEYALLALKSGAERAIGWDGDATAIDTAFLAARAQNANLTALVSDLSNPSPSQGWDQAERAGLQQRSGADAVMALALIHHLLFGANVPLRRALAWIVGLAPHGLDGIRAARRCAGPSHARQTQRHSSSLRPGAFRRSAAGSGADRALHGHRAFRTGAVLV